MHNLVTVAEYRRWLRQGLGRAVLHLNTHDAAPYRQPILYACLHNWSYDRQCEPNRAEYRFDIVQRTGEPEFYRDAIMKAISAGHDDWDMHLRDLLRLFAAQGDTVARQILYDTFLMGDVNEFESGVGLIALDGLEGFLFVANKVGATDASEYDSRVCGYLFSEIAERIGKEEVWDALAVGAIANPNIEQFVRVLREVEVDSPKKFGPSSIAGLAYDEVKPRLFAGKAPKLPEWGEYASDADILNAAQDLLQVTDVRYIAAYLRIFRNRRFPLKVEHLIRLAMQSDEQVAASALGAMSNINDRAVRETALELMRSRSPLRARGITALVSSFKEGDHALIEAFAYENLSAPEIHDLDFAVEQFYCANPNPESETQILLRLYEIGPCISCREKQVRRLFELNCLPDWMRAECEWDANPDTRQLVKEIVE